VRSVRDRTWDDLPWASHPVTAVYPQRRVRCRRCGIRTERMEFADPKARVTRRLRQQIGLDCQSMPTSHAAVRHGVSWSKARRAELAFLAAWDRTRPRKRPRHIGLDEIQRGKGQRFWTVLSDIVHGEVIGLRQDRTEAAATTLLTEELTGRQRAAITAATDMHRPYLNGVGTVLTHAEIVFDKFHVLQHASAALDDVRRQEFFRAGAVMREHGRGKRWLLLRRWKTVRGSKRVELQTLFDANRRLFRAYVLREQLDRLWTYTTRPGVLITLCWAGSGPCGGSDCLKWIVWESSSSTILRASPPTAIIPYGSGSSNRSTPPSKRSFAAREGCVMNRCCCSN
jgi:transposase